jgi:hypothetical protein
MDFLTYSIPLWSVVIVAAWSWCLGAAWIVGRLAASYRAEDAGNREAEGQPRPTRPSLRLVR